VWGGLIAKERASWGSGSPPGRGPQKSLQALGTPRKVPSNRFGGETSRKRILDPAACRWEGAEKHAGSGHQDQSRVPLEETSSSPSPK